MVLFKNELCWYFYRFGCSYQVIPWVKEFIISIVALPLLQAGVAFFMQFSWQGKPMQPFLGFAFARGGFILNGFVALLGWEFSQKGTENI